MIRVNPEITLNTEHPNGNPIVFREHAEGAYVLLSIKEVTTILGLLFWTNTSNTHIRQMLEELNATRSKASD